MKTKELVLYSIFTALIIVGAFVKIPIGPVPFTLQLFFVLLSPVLLGKKGWIPVALYLFIGLIGIPIFAYGGGIGYVLNPTFGYLIGFLGAAIFLGFLYEKKENWIYKNIIILVAIIIIYLFGASYLYIIKNFYVGKTFPIWFAIKYGILPFVIWDILKGIAVYFIGEKLKSRLKYD